MKFDIITLNLMLLCGGVWKSLRGVLWRLCGGAWRFRGSARGLHGGAWGFVEARGGGPYLLETRINNHNFPLFCGGDVEARGGCVGGARRRVGGARLRVGVAWRRVGGARSFLNFETSIYIYISLYIATRCFHANVTSARPESPRALQFTSSLDSSPRRICKAPDEEIHARIR